MKQIKTIILVVILNAVGFMLNLPVADAATQTLRVSPVIINVSLSPGKTYNHEVTIENLTDTPLPLRATLNDFITSGEEGGYIFEETKTNPLLNWIKLNETEFIINPKEKKKIQMTITTPKNIPLGGYYGVLFFEPVIQGTPNATHVSSKIGVLMLANVGVPDPNTQKAEIINFSTSLFDQDGSLPLLLRVKNISLNFFTAKPILSLRPIISFNSQQSTRQLTLEDKIIFPGQVRRWTEETTIQDLSPNIYKAHMAVSTGDGKYVSKDNYFVIFPIMKALIVAVVVSILVFLIVKRKRLKKALTALYK